MKQKKQPTDSPEEAKLISLRTCFEELTNWKFASLQLVLLCLLAARSCNLYKAADFAPVVGGHANFGANYARLCRFFATGIGDHLQKGVFRAVLRLALQSGLPVALVMDRTDWKAGSTWCNLLAVGLSFKGYFIPLIWADLGKRGNSDAATRLELLDLLNKWWPHETISPKQFPLVADREFAGEQWLLDLAKRGFSFVVRLKSNRKLTIWFQEAIRERPADARALRRFLYRKGLNSAEILLVGEYICHFVALKNTAGRDREPWIYFFTNLDDPQQASHFYQLRWTIECCFKHLKSNGFNLEDHGFELPHQVDILMAMAVLLYTVCLIGGVIQVQTEVAANRMKKPKKYPNGKTYPPKALFRIGLTLLVAQCFKENGFLSFVNDLFCWFSPAYIFT